MLLLWNERVLVTYFKEMNALFETVGNVKCMPAVELRMLNSDLLSLYHIVPFRKGGSQH